MKTLNTNDDLPRYFYIFSGRNNNILWNQIENHNIKLRSGILMSSGFNNVICLDQLQKEKFLIGDITYEPFIPNKTTSFGRSSPFMFRIINRYNLEYNLEWTRKEYFKNYPSRFSGIFAFGDLTDCIKISSKSKNWNLENLKKYELLFDESYNKYIKVIKANFKFIGLLENLPLEFFSLDNQQCLYNHYWIGGTAFNIPSIKLLNDVEIPETKCDSMNEYLIEGILEEIPFDEKEIKILKNQ